ncbi:MAG: VCBS repeat-containing protein [Candidatus Aminicenantes bacterium]|nr:VCBS repeat-containing protein [Candidatus Aminicenantes bacterium]
MARPEAKYEDKLASWKEIAAYLGCDERTCLRWEKKLGLPVHRMEGASKSRVFAFRGELDRWMREKITLVDGRSRYSRQRFFRPKILWILLAASGIAAAVFGAFLIGSRAGSTPSGFRIEDSTFIAVNKKGRALWSYNTGLFNLRDEAFYRGRFQIKKRGTGESPEFPQLIMRDIDNDRKVETLLSLKTQDEFNEGRLLCFNDRGKLLWEFETGKELLFGDSVYARDYRIKGFDLHDFDRDGRPEIFFISIHRPNFPCRFGVLNLRGELASEYWNSGHISDVVFQDIDRDSREEILMAGLNNEFGKGCLIVFEPDRIAGSSPQLNPDYTCRDLPPGSETYYLLLPRTDLDEVEYPVNCVLSIDVLQNRRLSLIMDLSRIFFELTPDLDVVYVHTSHAFQQKRAAALREGKVRGPADKAYFEKLRRGVLYWNGTDWVSTRTPNLHNYKENGREQRP